MSETMEQTTYPWERAALYGNPLPDGLGLEEQMAYTSLRNTVYAFHAGRLSEEQAAQEKRLLVAEYRARAEKREFENRVTAYHVRLIRATEGAKTACLKNPTPENIRRLVRVMDGIERPAQKEETNHGELGNPETHVPG